ncbi:MAG: hypothetical protein R2879_13285 [Saprospiraceae bacterium]
MMKWFGEYLPPMPLNQRARLFQRSDAINELYEKHKKARCYRANCDRNSCRFPEAKVLKQMYSFYYHPDSSTEKNWLPKFTRLVGNMPSIVVQVNTRVRWVPGFVV